VAQLHPRALGSLFVASYDPQGYGGGILTDLHKGHEKVTDVKNVNPCWIITNIDLNSSDDTAQHLGLLVFFVLCPLSGILKTECFRNLTCYLSQVRGVGDTYCVPGGPVAEDSSS
jgi:hypothetical protein